MNKISLCTKEDFDLVFNNTLANFPYISGKQ